MDVIRRDFLKLAGVRLGGFALPASASDAPKGAAAEKDASGGGMFDVRKFGAMADGRRSIRRRSIRCETGAG